MMYEGFANVYDHMMNHIPYETCLKIFCSICMRGAF